MDDAFGKLEALIRSEVREAEDRMVRLFTDAAKGLTDSVKEYVDENARRLDDVLGYLRQHDAFCSTLVSQLRVGGDLPDWPADTSAGDGASSKP